MKTHDQAQPECPDRGKADQASNDLDVIDCPRCLRAIVHAALNIAYGPGVRVIEGSGDDVPERT